MIIVVVQEVSGALRIVLVNEKLEVVPKEMRILSNLKQMLSN